MRKFALGKMSAAEVQQMAAAAVKSGANSPDMIGLQSLGGMGQVKGNIHRDLVRKHFASLLAPHPWKVRCPLQHREEGQLVTKEADCWLLLPHMWVQSLQEGNLLGALTCQEADLKTFWKSQRKNPQMTPQMWKKIDFSAEGTLPIPYAVHGDSAPFTETDSLTVVSFRCLLSQRSVGESQLLLAAIPKAAGTKEGWRILMEELSWSFKILEEGVVPKKKRHGTEEMPGKGKRFRKGWVWAVTGDLEWFASEFGFPYAASNLLCGYCLADQNFKDSTMPFTDFRPQAAWRKSCLTPAQLQEKFGGHPLLRLGCTSPLSIKLDVLHVLDLGVACYLHGSVLISIMNQLGGRTSSLAQLFLFFLG